MINRIHESPISLILWWPVYELIEEYEPKLRGLRDQPGVHFYPDGTACIDNPSCTQNAWNIISSFRQSGLELYSNTLYRSLIGFPLWRYQLLTTWEYFNSLGGEEGLLVFPTPYNIELPAERCAGGLPVCVRFRRSATKNVKEDFEIALQKWDESVKIMGMAGEGPARIVSLCVWSGRVAAFKIDVKTSGQKTLNWLTLTILNFAARTLPATEIRYGVSG